MSAAMTTKPAARRMHLHPWRPLTASDVELLAQHPRPTTRAECLPDGPNAQRPCPYVSCRHHLLLDVSRQTGKITFHPAGSLEALTETCALDVADRQGLTLSEVGHIIGVSHERVRQIEVDALLNARAKLEGAE